MKLILTPGNWDDRTPVLTLLEAVNGGITRGDLGYRGKQRVEEWAEEADLLVLTRADAPEKKCLLAQVRQALATTLCHRSGTASWTGCFLALGAASGTLSNSKFSTTTCARPVS